MSAPEGTQEGASRSFGELLQRPAFATRLFIAIAISVFAIYARLWLQDALGVTHTYVTFFLAIIIVSLICGFRLGLLSLSMLVIASDYYFIEPKLSFKIPHVRDILPLLLFSGTCLVVSAISEFLYRAHKKIVEHERKLREQSSSEAVISVQALRASEHRLGLALSAGRLGTWDLDLPTGKVVWNDEHFRMLGYETGEIAASYEAWASRIHPEDCERTEAAFAQALKDCVEFCAEYRTLWPDGTVRWLEGRGSFRRDAQGKATRSFGALMDITERKQAEAARAQLAAVVVSSNDAIISKSLDGTITSWNKGAELMFGYAAAEMIGASIRRIVPPDRQAEEEDILARIGRGEHLTNYETVRLGKEGRPIDVFVTVSPLFDEDGRIIGASKIACDITMRKQAQDALRKSEERFSAIVASAMDAIIVLDAEQKIILFNGAAEAMFGCKAEEAVGASIDRFIPERFRAAHREHIRVFGESGATTRSMGRLGAVCGLRTNGEEFLIEASISQFALGDKRIFTVILRDITERERAEAALKDADRRKDEFIATLAHELRNPLAPIRNGLAVLRRSGGQGENTERVQAVMERQVDHLIRLVDDLMEISRISRGKIELLKTLVDLGAVFEQAVEMNRDLIEAGGFELRVGLPDEPLMLEGDAVRLTQVFANLLNNAAKYTDPGGRIEITAERGASEAIVNVTDTGVGIAKDMLARVFDLFAQAGDRRGRSKSGLGIGLALVRNLVELHGGTVEAHSAGEGRGSRFVVRLPLASKIEASAPPSKPVASRAIGSRRVLIVDDAPDVGDSLALLLKTLGANVRVARSGAEGVATCAEFAPEVVFLDIGMPGMDGFETARRIRALPAGSKAMLVALTGWGEEETRRRVKEAGFDRHLTKPADLAEVETILGFGLRAPPRVPPP